MNGISNRNSNSRSSAKRKKQQQSQQQQQQQLQQQFSLYFKHSLCAALLLLPSCVRLCLCICLIFFAFDFAIVYFVFVFICPPEKNYICQNAHFLMCVCVFVRARSVHFYRIDACLAFVRFVVCAAYTHTHIHIFIVIFVWLHFVDCHWGLAFILFFFSKFFFFGESNYNILTIFIHTTHICVYTYSSRLSFGWLRAAINSKCCIWCTLPTAPKFDHCLNIVKHQHNFHFSFFFSFPGKSKSNSFHLIFNWFW